MVQLHYKKDNLLSPKDGFTIETPQKVHSLHLLLF